MAERNELALLKTALSATGTNPQEQTALENQLFDRLVTAGLTVSEAGTVGLTVAPTWPAPVLTTPLGAASGGTGIANNAASTLTISGNFATTVTVSGITTVTLPTSGTLQTTTGTPAGFVIASQATGDVLYASSATAWARLADVATGSVLVSGGVGVAPAWSSGPTFGGNVTISGTLLQTGVATFTALPVFSTALTTLGTITTGVWNAGAVTSSGLLTVNGFGTHAFSAGGTAYQQLQLRNTTAGTGNAARVAIGVDDDADRTDIDSYSSTWTTSSYQVQSGSALIARGSGGLSVIAMHASGAIRFYSGGTTERVRFDTNGGVYMYGIGSGTGTTMIIRDGSDFQVLRNSSSERYKENINRAWHPTSEQLRTFVRLSPAMFDYKNGGGAGVVNFIAEDAAATQLPSVYNRNAAGQPESLRNDSIAAYQHLVLQNHDARLAALESKQ